MAAAAPRIRASFPALVTLAVLLACGGRESSPAPEGEIPVAGQVVELRGNPETGALESLLIDLEDPAIGTPLPDPRLGATIRIHGSRETGACSARIDLDPSGWEESRGKDAQPEYRYRAPRSGAQGIESATLRPGRIVIEGSGRELPCDLLAGTQREPLSLELRTADRRYCAEFGGTVVKNELGRFEARNAAAPAACPPVRMNIVLIVADDLGYNGLSLEGSELVSTPQIDRLAAEGARFTSAYATAAICSPSRVGLLTGRYQQRFGFEFNTAPDRGLDPTVTTMADVMRAAGYVTGMVGKWHLGVPDRFHPLERGFDEFFGFLSGSHPYFTDRHPIRPLRNAIQRGKERANETAYLTHAFAREAVSFIERHRASPFFLYVPFNAVHNPFQAPEEYRAKFAHISKQKLRNYYAMTSALDDAVGAIVQAIEDQGIADDTLVVFTNDNGGMIGMADNSPLLTGKLFLFEGGVRVPMFIRWPGVTTPGQQYHEAVSLLDLFPTFLSAGGVPPPQGIDLDGADLSPFIRGDASGAIHEYLFWRTGANRAVRHHDWKLVQSCFPKHDRCNTWLFDLAADIGESTNLADEYPEVVAELLGALDEWGGELAPPSWPGITVGASEFNGMTYRIRI